MNEIIETLKMFEKKKPSVYVGEDTFMDLIVKFSETSESDKTNMIKKFKKAKLEPPKSYIDLLQFSNGLRFFEYSDCQIYDYEEALSCTDKEYLKKGLLEIATFREDTFYLNCKKGHDGVYVSMEGITDPIFLHMTFKGFIEFNLLSSFNYFWTWGREQSGSSNYLEK